ncbi:MULTISPECIES: hypothetical protein [unclassified Curtobacterium]|uniref:hypothetical protein n=1 Tax=unclassified Curtobacterium TaxID=257496 RepID=UPI00203BA725|nr:MULTISPECIES: hypothetical protein [unclassified Curtobacterium]MCM3504029.1 hypothetical protein [Curtobacterium sp. ODYSSEY 48 V2]MCM3521927.1 hypothetical protein [Curtobacterium sp. P97]MDT0211941.1 hypothetical protein [Curtobacterium sp. BRD11]
MSKRAVCGVASSVPFAVAVSLVLVGVGSVLASSDSWLGKLALGAALFVGIVLTGFAVRRHQRRR